MHIKLHNWLNCIRKWQKCEQKKAEELNTTEGLVTNGHYVPQCDMASVVGNGSKQSIGVKRKEQISVHISKANITERLAESQLLNSWLKQF